MIKDWDFGSHRYMTTNVPSEQEILLQALGQDGIARLAGQRRITRNKATDAMGNNESIARIPVSIFFSVL